jgi:hypothetical protein
VSKSITKANLSIRPSMARGNLQFIWQCHPKRKLSISSAILSQAQDGHFCSAIFFEEHAGQDRHSLFHYGYIRKEAHRSSPCKDRARF